MPRSKTEEQMPFDGSSWKRWDDEPERLWSERGREWLVRGLLVMTCIAWASLLSLLVTAVIGELS